MNKIKNALNKLFSTLSVACKKINILTTADIPHPYKIIKIQMHEDDSFIAYVQLVGKGQTFKLTPQEILSSDKMTCSFSQKDIRLLTYLGYLNISSPQYKILAQRLLEKENKIIFAIKKRGEPNALLKTAQEITPTLLQNFDPQDAHLIGYRLGAEEQREEKNEMENVLRDANKTSEGIT